MTKFNLNEEIEKAEQEHNIKGESDWYELKEGGNIIRILTPMIIFPQHFSKAGYKGICLGKDVCPGCKEDSNISIKWLCWVWDKGNLEESNVKPEDHEIKLARLPHKVAKQIQDYQNNPEYAFDEAPMPYDLTISAKNAGTKEVEYNTTAARTNTDVPIEVMEKLSTKNSTQEIKEKIKEKKLKELGIDNF